MFFYFPKVEETNVEKPLCRIGGELLIDSGNEDPTYIYRSQERYLPYTCMINRRSLFFVRDTDHLKAYRDRLEVFKKNQAISAEVSGFSPETIEPVFVELTPDLSLGNFDHESFPRHAIGINQLSPTLVGILVRIAAQAESNCDLEHYGKTADLALHLSNKAEYVRLVEKNDALDLPRHAATLILKEDSFFDLDFEALQHRFKMECDEFCTEFFVKSALDSGGEICGIVNSDNYEHKTARLRRDSIRKRPHKKIEFLIQKRLPNSSCVGFSYYIHTRDKIERLTASEQIYEDEERKEFLGAIVSDRLEKTIFRKIDESKVINLCRLFADLDYRGPINFDAIENTQGDYEFVGDCNPRLSAVYPNLAVREFLSGNGIEIASIANLGYRGRIELEDFASTIKELGRHGLLFSRAAHRGIWIVPSFTGEHRFDFWFVNMPNQEIERFVGSSHFAGILHSNSCDIDGVYF
ncbi:MAG: hypothetical protein GY866_13340 [Proteobacteria bacterium]|nr:hypothetical protein [Pseudomonadota bacterium]